MTNSKELEEMKQLFSLLGRVEVTDLLNKSNLSDRELDFMISRFVKKQSLKECSELFGVSENAIAKLQIHTIHKLYNWIISREHAKLFLSGFKIPYSQINYK